MKGLVHTTSCLIRQFMQNMAWMTNTFQAIPYTVLQNFNLSSFIFFPNVWLLFYVIVNVKLIIIIQFTGVVMVSMTKNAELGCWPRCRLLNRGFTKSNAVLKNSIWFVLYFHIFFVVSWSAVHHRQLLTETIDFWSFCVTAKPCSNSQLGKPDIANLNEVPVLFAWLEGLPFTNINFQVFVHLIFNMILYLA